MTSYIPAQTGLSRVFIIEGRARPDHRPAYHSHWMAGSPSIDIGDIERIESNDPDRYDKFIEIGTIQGARSRATLTLTGRYALELKSTMLRLANQECHFDVQINFGACDNPREYNTFNKKLVLEDVAITNYSATDLGALSSDSRSQVDESVDISAESLYELVQVSLSSRAGDIVTNEVVDITHCDNVSCGDCDDQSDGCSKYFAVTVTAGGSPGTPADVVFTLNGGTTWLAHDIETLSSEDASGIACLGAYVVVVSETAGSISYALTSEFTATGDPEFTEVTTGFVSGAGPTSITTIGNKAFITGANGYVYMTEDPTGGVTALDSGVLYTDDYNKVDALTEEFAVAVGDAGRIIKTENGTTWGAVEPSPVGVSVNLTSILVKDKSTWLIGTSTGNFYYTLNGGTTWTLGSFSGSGSGVVRDIVAATDSVLYMAHDTATPKGRILRSTNGGYDWVVMPEGSGVLPANDRINALATCPDNADIVIGVGLADDGSDGFIIVGND